MKIRFMTKGQPNFPRKQKLVMIRQICRQGQRSVSSRALAVCREEDDMRPVRGMQPGLRAGHGTWKR